MAVVNRTSLIASVAIMRTIDNGARDLLFNSQLFFESEKVEFDITTLNGEIAGYNAFSQTAKVVKKDGYDTVSLAPLNINESINITAENTKVKAFGQSKYGGAVTDAAARALETELNGFAKLKKRGDRAIKKAMYEAMLTGKIVYGQNGIPEIDFNMPAANKEVETGADLWSETTSDPIAKIIAVYDSMDVSPEAVILSETAKTAFLAHAKVTTTDNITTGKKRNLIVDETETPKGAKFIKIGRLVERPVDVYVELDTYRDAAGDPVKYMTDGFVAFGSAGSGQMLYGGIPMGVGQDIVWEATDMMLTVDTKENPVSKDRIFKSAPLPTLKNAVAFYSLKVLA